ncbi:hypothetical protein [Streptomyces sp. SID5910]|uniref:hypothetical protein n=1 Tax=Streptomyces sp. SID5910 TaxID=2690312 RepID=UPI00136B2BEE|nr:hypothetical protein [Streptomyces sp. SID5910]MYR42818.1 hypothetical protein [Streptomyces sp. SID5910]
MTSATLRRAAALGFGALWCWAVVRLVLAPGAGAVEGAVAVGGWGLSVLPVHCVPKSQAVGAVGTGRWRRALRAEARSPGSSGPSGPSGPGRARGGPSSGVGDTGER